jgi:hypothetical protein
MGWNYLTQDRDQWQAHMNTVMNLQVHEILGNSCVPELVSSQQGLKSVGLISYRKAGYTMSLYEESGMSVDRVHKTV